MEYRPGFQKQDVLRLLQGILPEIDFEGSDSLVGDGTLTSLSIVMIVSELSVEYGINIPYDAVVRENFDSLDAIVGLVERLRKG